MEEKIYQAIAAVMADVGAVGKDATNQYDKYRYRSIDAVMNAMHPAMAKHHVFVTPEVLEQSREERQSAKGGTMIYSVSKVRYTFYTDDGSSVQATVIGEGSDRGDKSMNKAMSAAFKYALFQVFCIPTEEMVDSEKDSAEFAPKAPASVQQPAQQPIQRPAPAPEAPEEAFPYSDYAFAHPKDRINNMQIDVIASRAAQDAVPLQVILDLYKVTSIAELSNYKYCDIMGVHWDAIKQAGEKYKAPVKRVSINDI